MGVLALIGPKNAFLFFSKKSKLHGSLFYFLGFFMILLGWYLFTLLGFVAQMYGLFIMFRSFLTTILGYAQNLPVIGPIIKGSSVVNRTIRYIEEKEGTRKRAKFEV